MARDHINNIIYNEKVNPNKGALPDEDNNDINYDSDTSDLLSLQEIFRQNKTRFRTRNNFNSNAILSRASVDRTGADGGREGNSKEIIACLNAGTVLSVTILNGDRRTYEVMDLAYTGDRSLELPRGCIDPVTNQEKNTTDYSTKYDTANCTGQEQDRGIK
ncbi:hypothetical protein PV08_05172 [Exophiala spinifera]|uniref:Uncharacterized protein n=1 Tax=Exophiala spinifera TaxID=91928 RepID=A0A0D1ZZ90_9EURO|nr:uncharacterized protein PV08_05172 [Exophiala spinifera]KIW17977.1 hypothetical protein PV08_05172 [Exophiala spinifera]